MNKDGLLGKSDNLKSVWLGTNDLEPGQFETLGVALKRIEEKLQILAKPQDKFTEDK